MIAVVKLRGSPHCREFRQFDVVDGELKISAVPFGKDGILSGCVPRNRAVDPDRGPYEGGFHERQDE